MLQSSPGRLYMQAAIAKEALLSLDSINSTCRIIESEIDFESNVL